MHMAPLDTTLNRIAELFERFERWFDRRFGWFFTNGMKDRTRGQGTLRT